MVQPFQPNRNATNDRSTIWWNGVRGRTPSRNSRQTLSPMDWRFQNPGVRWKSQRSFCSSLSCCGRSSVWMHQNCWVQTTKRNTLCKMLMVMYLHLNNTISYHFYSYVSQKPCSFLQNQTSNTVCSASWLLTWSNCSGPLHSLWASTCLLFFSWSLLSIPGGPRFGNSKGNRETCNVIEGLELQMCNSTSGSESCIFVRFHVIDH